MSLSVGIALIVVFALAMYVLLDGFDLGVGGLLLATNQDEERDAMVESIAPIWDGNQTWLILTGIVLFAAFPLAYSTLLPAVYLPAMIMLMALGFRGVSFEFRAHSSRRRGLWDRAFCWGSIVATLCQGLILGAAIKGIPMKDGEFAGTTFSFLSGTSVLSAFVVLTAYSMLGATWLYWRSEGTLQLKAAKQVRRALVIFAILACLQLAVIVFGDGPAAAAWQAHATLFLIFAPCAALLWFFAWRSVGIAPGRARFFCMALVLLFLVGFAILVWPYIIPFSVTITEASAPSGSQLLLLTGVLILLPVVLANSAYVYMVFRRKVAEGAEEH